MRPTPLILSFLSITLATSHASAAPVERTLTLPGFTAVGTSGVDVDIKVGPASSVVVKGEPAELAKLEVIVEKGELKFRPRRDIRGWNWRSNGPNNVTARVTTPTLREASIGGSGSIVATGINAKKFDIEIGGSGSFTSQDARIDEADLSIGGSGNITLGGTCKKADIEIGGSGKVRARDFKCSDVEIDIGGSGDVEAFASQSVDTSIAGGGDVAIYGNPPTRRKSIAGSGSITYPGK
jgi:Putative auto-transporter adhesin, head GIN domain